MEKAGDDAASKFINALIKSVQTLCHGYLDFHNGIEIIGHINLSVDQGNSMDYILKEKVCKNAENSTLFISNSFHAEPKPEQEVPGKNSQTGSQVVHSKQSTDSASGESGKVSSAISSISSALSGSRERHRRSSVKDSDSHSQQSTAKRKASEDHSESRPAKVPSHHDQTSSGSPYPPTSSSPEDSKMSLRALASMGTSDADMSETMLPQTANVTSDNAADIGVNLAGSVLEPVDDQSNPDLPERDDDSDGDLEVTFIKEEYVEGERSACEYDNSGQQFGDSHHRGSEGMSDPSLFPVALHSSSSASATYVPSAHELGAIAQHFPPGSVGPSTSQPQPGPSGMRGVQWTNQQPSHSRHARSAFEAGRGGRGGAYVHIAADINKLHVFRCQFCTLSFSSANGLSRHKSVVHSVKKPGQHICTICGKGITRKDDFEDHMNRHRNIKAHKCPHCGQQFTFKNNLRQHMRTGVCSKYRNMSL